MYLISIADAFEGDDCVALVFFGDATDLPLLVGVADIDVVSHHQLLIVVLFDLLLIHIILKYASCTLTLPINTDMHIKQV